MTCLLEHYDAESGRRFRAYGAKKNPAFPDGTLLVFRAGQIPMMSDEWMSSEQVADVFCCFSEGKELPKNIHWRLALIT